MGKLLKKKNFKNEKGSIIVEAAFSLPFFMFVIVSILSFVNICSAQALLTNAINSAAADFGKISYVYCKLGILDWKADAAEAGSDVTQAGQTLMGMDLGNFEQTVTDLESAATIISDCEDLGGSLMGALKECFADAAESFVGDAVMNLLLKSRLSSDQVSADDLLKHYGIQEGLDGVSWKMRFDPSTDELLILATYKVRVLDFFDLEYDYEFQKLTRTVIWDPTTNYPSGEESGE